MATTEREAGQNWNWVRTGRRDGPTVLLLHAVGLDLTFWGDQVDWLQAKFDVIAVDLPGHGRSPAPSRAWSFESAASELVDLLATLNVDAAHVVGLSFGGMLAQQLALSHPARVRSLLLLATAASFPDDARTRMVEHADAVQRQGMASVLPLIEHWMAPDAIRRRPDVRDRVASSLLRMDSATYAQIWRMIAGFDVLGSLGAVTCPTRAVAGDRDGNTPPECAEAIAAAVRSGSHAVMRDASHLMIVDSPAEVAGEMRAWLEDRTGI